MSIKVLEIIPTKLHKGKISKENLRQIELCDEAESALLSELAPWTFMKIENTSLSHEEMGDYEGSPEIFETSLLLMLSEVIVKNGSFFAVMHDDMIFYTNGTAEGITSYDVSYENGRSTYHSRISYKLKKQPGVTLLDGVIYQEENGNKFYMAKCVMRNLTEVSLHPETKIVAIGAFKDCRSLRTVRLQSGVTFIGNDAFKNCVSLSEIHFPDSVVNLESGALAGCKSLKRVILSKSIKQISTDLFRGCTSLGIIEIPENIEYIAADAFKDCSSLHTVILPANMTSIDAAKFSGCSSLVEIITDAALSIKYMFSSYSAEEWRVVVHSGESFVKEENGFVFYEKDAPILIGYNGSETEIILPKDYKGEAYTVKSCAFSCTAITSLTLLDAGISLSPGAFSKCESLKSAHLPTNLLHIPERLFYWCENLASVNLPKCLETIGKDAFALCDFESVTIPDSVKTIGDGAFSGGTSLREVKIGSGVRIIGAGAFSSCRRLKSVFIAEGVERIQTAAFSKCSSLESINLPTTLTTLGDSVFRGCTSLHELPLGLKQIPDNCFEDCENLIVAEIEEGVKTIGSSSFANCASLEWVYLPKSINLIKEKAFFGCDKLSEVHFKRPEIWREELREPKSAAKYFRTRDKK